VGKRRAVIADIIAATSALARAGALRPTVPSPSILRLGLRLPYTIPSLETAVALQAALRPELPAIFDDRGVQTWRETDERVSRLAHVLRGRSSRGGRAAFLVRNGREAVECYAGSARAGLAAVPINTWSSAGDLEHIAATQRPGVVVVDPELADGAAEAFGEARLLRVGVEYETALAAAPATPPLGRGNARIVTHTSGTTGRPKGAERDLAGMASHARDALNTMTGFLERVPLHRDHTFCIASPLFHAFGQGMLGVAVVLGTTLVLPAEFDAERLLSTIADEDVDAVALVPVQLRRLLEVTDPPPTPSWRIGILSGSALPPSLRARAEDRFGPIFHDLYGSTEVGFVTIATPEDTRSRPGTVGRPTRGIEVAAVDADGHALPPGAIGELRVRTGMAFEGYTGMDAEDDGDDESGLGMGDLGYLDEDGYLFVTGRVDDMVVSGGENIYPSEVEAVLDGHPDVADVVVIGVEDEEYGEVLHAHVVPRDGADLQPGDVVEHARAHLARYKVPKQVHLQDSLPRNAAGKVVRARL
jgi:fatty-acyl-CoA synthase